MNNYSIKDMQYYISQINSEENLREIALNDGDCDVRKAAVEKLTKQEVLEKLALNAKDYDVRKLAVEKIANSESIDESRIMKLINSGICRKFTLMLILKLSKESIKNIRTDDWYIKEICNDILKNQ